MGSKTLFYFENRKNSKNNFLDATLSSVQA